MAEGAVPKQRAGKRSNHEDNIDLDDSVEVDMMSEAANRRVREKYRDLINSVEVQADGAGHAGLDVHSLHTFVLQANDAFTSVKRPREAAMDAQFLRTCGTLAKLSIESAQSNLAVFKPTEFAQKLKHFVMTGDGDDDDDIDESNDEMDWHRFGRAVSSLYKRAVGIEPIYGALEWQRPKPAPRAAKKQDTEAGPKTKPHEMVSGSSGEERQTEEVTRIYKILDARFKENKKRPLCFFTFVVNPHSFMHTVENLFHTSFLFRDQYAVLTEDENGLPVIAPRQLSSASHTGGVSHQSVISLTKSDWKQIVETFEIKEPMIPPPTNTVKRKC